MEVIIINDIFDIISADQIFSIIERENMMKNIVESKPLENFKN
jgi:hypothetical protein